MKSKKRFLIPVFIFFLFVFICYSVSAADTIEKTKGYISLNLSDSKEISPNQAEINIGIKTSDKSLQKACESNKIIANRVYSSLKTLLGIDDYIKTNNYSARPQYSYTRENKQILEKYVVSNIVTVKTKNTELVSKLIDTSISQGATNIENLQFSASNCDDACKNILTELTKKAYNQANSIAKSINSEIIGIKSINVTCNKSNNVPRTYCERMSKDLKGGSSSTPVECGKIKIYANIRASFYVK